MVFLDKLFRDPFHDIRAVQERISEVNCGEISNAMQPTMPGTSALLAAFCWVYMTADIRNLCHVVAFAICLRFAVKANPNGDLT